NVDVFKLDTSTLSSLLRAMAYNGEWKPFFDYLNAEVKKQASIRDHLNGEKVLQGFMIAYLNVTYHFFTWSERESGGGFVDLYLEPFVMRFPDMNYGYLIELKYMSEKQYNGENGKTNFDNRIEEAEQQLHRYASDERLQQYADKVTFKKVVLGYVGWQLKVAKEV
ncbi:MAG: PD-(D/E)XK nuclease domain-containing protein, partial [Chloroflexota bacterium]